MKKIIIILYSILVCNLVYGQDPEPFFELNAPEPPNQTRDYLASEYISLLPSFHADPNTGKFVRAHIDPLMVFPPTSGKHGGAPNNNEGGVVGTISGQASVSPSGGAVYSIPIKLPVGINGMTPGLTLSYNSQSGNGTMGIGWNLTGLSVISRVGSTIYNDGKVDGIDFDADDHFAIDGNRLISIGLAGGGVEYRTEIESFSKIIAFQDSYGPFKFKVWTKDGLIMEYGYTPDSRIEAQNRNEVLFWMVNRIEDRKGNFINFTYSEFNGQGFIQEIAYTGNDQTNLEPFYTINFTYLADRNDAMKYFISGSAIENDFLMASIAVSYNTSQVMRYDLEYDLTGFQNHLKRIKLTMKDGQSEEYFNPTLFNWGTEDHQFATETLAYNYVNTDRYYLDINGDGKTDMVEAYWSLDGNNLKVYSDWKYRLREENTFSGQYDFTNSISGYLYNLIIGDFNGDGFMDIVRFTHTDDDRQYIRFDLIMFGKASGGFDEYELNGGIDIKVSHRPQFNVGDFDGNGIQELVVVVFKSDNEDSNVFAWRFTEDASHFTELFREYHYFNDDDLDKAKVIAADFTGEGATDLLITNKIDDGSEKSWIYEVQFNSSPHLNLLIESGYPTNWHRVFVGEFNGDGIADILTYNWFDENPQWEIFCFNGIDSWIPFGDVPDLYHIDPLDPEDQYWYGLNVSDYNGDGLSDIIQFKKRGQPGYPENVADFDIYYNNGHSFYTHYADSISCIGGLDLYGGFYHNISKHLSLDFNGDGRTDLYKYQGYYDDEIVFFDVNNYQNLLNETINGFGSKVRFTYLPITDQQVYSKGSGANYPLIDLQAPVYVVSNMYGDNGIGGEFANSYKYNGAKVHKEGKGFLGFSGIMITNQNTNIINCTENGINEDYYYAYLKSESCYDWPTLLSKTYYLNDVHHFGSKRIFSYTPESLFLTFNAGDEGSDYVSSVRTDNFYDNEDIIYGNISKQIVYTDPDYKTFDDPVETYDYKSDKLFSYNEDIDNWLINRPDTVIILKQVQEQSVDSVMTYFDYYGEEETNYPELKLTGSVPNNEELFETITSYEYDNYGNIISRTLSAPNYTPALEPSTETYAYSPNYEHRFLTTKSSTINNISHSNYFAFNPSTGDLVSSTDLNGHTTHYEYGIMGDLEKTIHPDGTLVFSVNRWADNETVKPENALFYQWQKSSGNAETYDFFDCINRKLRTVGKNFNGENIFIDNIFNNKGQLFKTSELYSISGQENWTEYTFLNNGKIKITESPLSTILCNYNGRTILTQNQSTGKEDLKVYDAVGNLVQSSDECGSVICQYYSSGNVKQIETNGSITLFSYDKANRQKCLDDPDAGSSTYKYNAFGQLESQTDANGNTISMNYDELGRLIERNIENTHEIVNYLYDTQPNGVGLISSVAGPGVYEEEFYYDELSRLIREDEAIDGNTYSYSSTYDIFGRVKKEFYPSGFSTIIRYDTLGYLRSIARGDTEMDIWKLEEMNPRGQITKFSLGNSLSTTHSYDSYGYLTAINTDQAVQSLSYNFERASGNLLSRSDNNYNLTEEFSYDENLLNSRLIQCKINGNISLSTCYQNNGNIDTKSDVGTYTYHDTKLHALETVVDPDPDFIDNSPLQQISYTPFGKIRTIDQQNAWSPANPYHLDVYYGPDDQRIKTELYYGSTKIKTKLFGESGYEIISDNNGNKTQLNYLTSPSGVYAVFIKSNDGEAIYYLHTDHLGSLYAITDQDGKIITQAGKEAIYSFDAWGRRRNPENWTYEGLPSAFLIDRGFTFHEHLDEFGLINMNGRVYDPVIGRFLSPDNYVQSGMTQSFNRYSYCQNNPLVFSDPGGENPFALIWPIACFANMYIADATSNLINGVNDPFGTAWNNATNTYNGMNNALQLSIYQDNDTRVSVGISPFSLGISANISQKEGNMMYTASGGIGIGGWFVNGGASYTDNHLNIGVSIGAGNNHWAWGANATYDGFGVGYYQTRYGNNISAISGTSNPQSVGGINILLNDFSIRMENDFFMFNHQDRWRSNGLEIGYKQFSIGTYLYNNDPEGTFGKEDYSRDIKSPFWGLNRPGKDGTKYGGWKRGYTYMAPLYFGYNDGTTVYRIGYSHRIFQDFTQNGVHKYIGRQHYYANYEYFNYGMYYYQGWSDPYSLWGR